MRTIIKFNTVFKTSIKTSIPAKISVIEWCQTFMKVHYKTRYMFGVHELLSYNAYLQFSFHFILIIICDNVWFTYWC